MYSPSPRALYKYISYLVDDLEITALKDANDTVDIEAFWRQIELSIMARRLIRGMGTKLFPLLSLLWWKCSKSQKVLQWQHLSHTSLYLDQSRTRTRQNQATPSGHPGLDQTVEVAWFITLNTGSAIVLLPKI